MKKIILGTLFLFNLSLSAQTFNKEKLDSLFSIIETNEKGMGSISIFKDKQEVYHYEFGYASIEDNIKANEETKYRIGSISKTFTASIIMKLVEEGKLTLDTTLDKYFPEIKNSDRITMKHLLKHQSGIFNFTNATDLALWMENPISKGDLIKKIVAFGNIFEPGEKTDYSNSNYVLLSLIAEKITSKDFSIIIEDYITKPFKLTDTYYGSKINIENNEALSYTNLGSWKKATETDMSVPLGAGAIVSTPKDLNTFLNLLFNEKIVSKKSLELMKIIENGMGIGMFKIPFYEKFAFGHNGGIDGFQSNASYFPEEKVSIAYTTNGVSMPMNDILIGVLSIYFDRDYEFPVFTEVLELSTEDLDKYLGVYSSPTFPLKLTIFKKDEMLFGQATGQPSFPLEAFEIDKFKFDQAQLKLEFNPDENKMILLQAGGKFELKKE